MPTPLSRRAALRLLTLAAPSLALLQNGCGGGSHDTVVGILPNPTGRFGDLQYSSSTDKSVYSPGETVTITFVIRNVGTQTLSMTGTPPDADARVRRASDDVVLWTWSQGKVFPAFVDLIQLAPGESRTFTFTWDQKDQQGNSVPKDSYVIETWAYEAPGLTIVDRDSLSNLLGAPLLHITIC